MQIQWFQNMEIDVCLYSRTTLDKCKLLQQTFLICEEMFYEMTLLLKTIEPLYMQPEVLDFS